MEGFVDKETLRRLCLEAGACAAGFARIQPVSDEAIGIYERWLEEGRHGRMSYLAAHARLRRDPALLLEGAVGRTLISCAFA